MIGWQEVLVRLLVALLFCGVVGVERFLAGKAAGVRTHILVGMGAALFTLISGYAFHTTPANADRIAAQVVSGIGFIGGGAILKEGAAIKGLTTAAGLWAVAALGMAAGAGLYTIGAFGTVIIMATLVILHRVERHLPRRMQETWEVNVTMAEPDLIQPLRDLIASSCPQLAIETAVFGEQTHLTFTTEASASLDILRLTRELRAAGASQVSWQAHEKIERGA